LSSSLGRPKPLPTIKKSRGGVSGEVIRSLGKVEIRRYTHREGVPALPEGKYYWTSPGEKKGLHAHHGYIRRIPREKIGEKREILSRGEIHANDQTEESAPGVRAKSLATTSQSPMAHKREKSSKSRPKSFGKRKLLCTKETPPTDGVVDSEKRLL